MTRPLSILIVFVLPLLAWTASAATPLESIKSGKADAETLAAVLPELASETERPAVLAALQNLDPFPREALVSLLGHPQLAVRLGALELLEERAGGDFDFDPWLPPGDPANEAPLALWQNWLKKGAESGKPKKSGARRSLLDDDQRRGYLRDLLGNDPDKATRARHMLEADGLAAVGFLEDFLEANPTLPPGSMARIRQAQYQVVLSRSMGRQASVLARNLTFGNRDQLLAALVSTKSAGLNSLPILRQFLEHPDPLVRETAIDTILAAGKDKALAIVGPVLLKEKDINVIHGALRRIKDIHTKEAVELVSRFLDHPDEDLLVSAIQTCLSLAGDSETFFVSGYSPTRSKTDKMLRPIHDAVIKAVDDPRWRVRTAALEFVAKRRVKNASDAVMRHLDDPDDFVRFSAIKAAAALSLRKALPKLKKMLLANEEMADAVLQGYGAMDKVPDQEIVDFLKKASPETRIAAIRAAGEFSILSPIVLQFAADDNLDVACAALRFLAKDDDRVKDPKVASVLALALQSGQTEKLHAVADRLYLPQSGGGVIDPALLESLGRFAKSGEPTALDPLYDAFLETKTAASTKPLTPKTKTLPQAQKKLIGELVKLAKGKDGDLAFAAALDLARAGYAEGFKVLESGLGSMTTARKTAIADRIYAVRSRAGIPVFRKLLRDPVSEVRSEAADSMLNDEDAPAIVSVVLEELVAPDALLKPKEAYGYQFESAVRSRRCSKIMRNFGTEVLKNTSSSTAMKVLGTIALRNQAGGSAARLLEETAKSSSDPLVRRAAWFSIGWASPSRFRKSAAPVAADPSPLVREVLPVILGGDVSRRQWRHRFSDVDVVGDNAWSSSSRKARVVGESKKLLENLAASDPSPVVRFECLFTLMAAGHTIDVDAMLALLPKQPKKAQAPERLAYWFQSNASRVGPGLRPLFTAIDTSEIDSSRLAVIEQRLSGGGKSDADAFATFSALARQAESPKGGQQQQAPPEPEAESAAAKRASLPVLFFVKPGCKECAQVREILAKMKADFPKMGIEEVSVAEKRGILLNQAICDRMGVPAKDHLVTPAVFAQGGFLIHNDIVPKDLAKLLADTMALPQDDSWKNFEEPEIAEAEEQIESRYSALTFWVVLTGGLLDGINPCAFATIIFFLSYLQIARRTPREMLMTGAAFISAVFLAYFAAGLVLYQILETLHNRVGWLQQWLNWSMAGLALVAAILSFRDANRARAGRLDEMTLQLPAFLKTRIRGVIRTGARARRFVIAAFLAGIVISFLELACTGQIYAPIVYQIQQGRLDAVAWLALYNLAFIVPLVVIFALAYGGLRSETLIGFQKRHTTAVKVGLGIVFLALAALILFGHKLLPG